MYALAPRGSNIKEFGELVRGFWEPVLVARKPVEDVAPVTKPEIAPLPLARDPGANCRGDAYTGTGISC
jgi:hypothetical protein